MQTLLLVAAEAREFAGLRRRCCRDAGLRWPLRFARVAELNGRRLILVAHGAGRALASQACETAWNRQKAEAVVSMGYCGALDPVLGAGEIFIATQVEAPDEASSIEARTPECARRHASGRLISVDRVIQTVEEKKSLRALGASAVEMEAMAVGGHAREWGVPFFCVRGITDLASEGFSLNLNAARAEDGRLSAARIMWAAMGRPAALAPEIYRLYHRSRMAARALGDYLADCQF